MGISAKVQAAEGHRALICSGAGSQSSWGSTQGPQGLHPQTLNTNTVGPSAALSYPLKHTPVPQKAVAKFMCVYYIYICMYACMYACMHVCMFGCMYVCMYMYLYTHVININK